jgi:hypothetical protein
MLTVIGEALIDLIVDPDRHVVARPGGRPYNTREIRRCLKRYIARELYRQLTQTKKPPTGP